MSSDSSEEDDNPPEFIPSSNKDIVKIKHPGVPPPEHSPFANQAKHPKWPEDLWEAGALIYDVRCPDKPRPVGDRTLVFDSWFESGNLYQVYQLSSDTYHCILEYDKNKSQSCQWFYFKILNIRPDTKYTFFISGFHKNTGLFTTGSKIFWYSEKQYKKMGYSWSRGGTNYSYTQTRGKKKGKRSSLQFQIKFPYENDVIYLSYALPYTYSDLMEYIRDWESKAPNGCLSHEILGKTIGGKECPILQIVSPNPKCPIETRPCLFFTGRIHPGESNGSVVLHGLIDYLISDSSGASFLRENYIIRIVPMVNIDGVVEGFYRISLSGQDLNRVWKTPDPVLHPIVCKIKDLIFSIAKERNIAAYIDFHGHSRLHGTFAYGCPNDDDPKLKNHEKLLPRMISFLCDAFSWSNCIFSFPKERQEASRIVVRTEASIVNSFTIETSFGGIPNGPRGGFLYDELIWKEIGAKCGEALFHMLLGNESPVTSYVEQELSFLSPDPDEACEEEDKPETPECDLRFETVTEILEVPSILVKNPVSVLHLSAPKQFLTTSSGIISSVSPGYCAPKWSQLSFTEN